jgi:hypothetical protein
VTAPTTEPANPYDVCTWRPVSACRDCPITTALSCRFNWGDLLYFLVACLPAAVSAVVGMLRGGYGRYLLGWLGFALFFFVVWEARVLCRHCPYYAGKGLILHCLANHGVLKIWRFHPGPMSVSEKVQFLVGAAILVLFPFPFLALSRQFGMLLITAVGVLSFAWSLVKNVCPRCVNFSCPLNRVPKAVVDEYLRRNPVMRGAWEQSGWQIGE